MKRTTQIVVPCYNEAQRLDDVALLSMVGDAEVGLVLVDDGSTDATLARLEALALRSGGKARVLSMRSNQGKAEAVRCGLLSALENGAQRVGYFDADMSTPPEDLRHLLEALSRPGVQFVMGARVALLGRRIERSPGRHYLGRVFATIASGILQIPIYDSQCGAKVMLRSRVLEDALSEPFRSRWVFDVELIGRLLAGSALAPGLPLEAFVELPLQRWREVEGSSLKPGAMVRVLGELAGIGLDLSRRRKNARQD